MQIAVRNGRLFTSSRDLTVKMWETEGGDSFLQVFKDFHSLVISALAYSPGKVLTLKSSFSSSTIATLCQLLAISENKINCIWLVERVKEKIFFLWEDSEPTYGEGCSFPSQSYDKDV